MFINLSRPGFWARQDMPDDGDEWIGYDRMVEVVREHNEADARREQNPDWILDVGDELRRARAKFPGTNLLTTAFAEEAGELVKAILDGYNGKASDIYTEAIQTIAMVVRLLEEGDPIHRLEPIAPRLYALPTKEAADAFIKERVAPNAAVVLPELTESALLEIYRGCAVDVREAGGHHSLWAARRITDWFRAYIQPFPADRVLGDGKVAVDAMYLAALHVAYGTLLEHMETEGGIPMTDALAAAMARIDATCAEAKARQVSR